VSGFVGAELPDILVLLSRSGAGTLAELTALGNAAVSRWHLGMQRAGAHARHLQESGAAVALEGEVSGDRMRDVLGPLLDDVRLRQAMAERARAHGRPDVADQLVDVYGRDPCVRRPSRRGGRR
jgi:UDP-N-acetylglucosamine--N-acetylmuramyl-(pentapeptide) pyrophosphoryl-undecaprenol N-acetylglucosamine transferase